jgi:hypothetical protein
MKERNTLRAIYETVRYLEQDAEGIGADSVAMYLRLAAIEADTMFRDMEKPSDTKPARKRRSPPPE